MAAFAGPYPDTTASMQRYVPPPYSYKLFRINERGFREEMTWEGFEKDIPRNVLRAGWKKIKNNGRKPNQRRAWCN